MYTELEALNFLLSHVGAAPVTSVANPLPDLASAQLRLHEAMVWTQKQGWWFNRLLFQTFTPDDETNEIDLPANTLKILGSYPVFVIERDGKAYNPLHATFEFSQPFTADLVLFLEWEEIPPSAQDAVLYRAAQTMILHELEDSNKAAALDNDTTTAYVTLKEEDLQIKQRHAYSTPAVQRFMRRIRPYKRRSGNYNPIWPGGGS